MSDLPARPAEADALFVLLRERYGDRLTPEQLEELRKAVAAQAEAARALRRVALGNSDEPMPTFAPFRAEP
jgi:hypothetical protein